MSQLRVYETSRPAAAATATAFSPITQTHLFLLPAHRKSVSSSPPFSLAQSFSPCRRLYVSHTHTHTHRQSVYRLLSRSAPPSRVQTIRNIKLISPRVYIVLII